MSEDNKVLLLVRSNLIFRHDLIFRTQDGRLMRGHVSGC